MERQLRMGGGIMDVVPREPAIFGGIKRAVKKATKSVKKIAKSDLGKAALAGAALYGLGGAKFLGGEGIFASGQGLQRFRNFANLPSALGFGKSPLIDSANTELQMLKRAGKLDSSILSGVNKALSGNVGKIAALAGVSTFLTKSLGMTEEQAEEELARDPSKYLELYYRNLNPPTADTNSEEYEAQVRDFVATNTSEYTAGQGGYAEGGRIGFADGPVLPPDTTQPVNPFGPKPGDFGIEDNEIKMASNIENDKILEALFEKYIDMGLSPKDAAEAAQNEFDRMSKKRMEPTIRGVAALGGKMDTASDNAMQAAGIEGLPVRQNPKGVKELDLRETGGFIPPVGIKEKEDDIPAMLSNNEFVFTADAVRNMGDGNVNVGAQRMYDMMKKLEAGGRV